MRQKDLRIPEVFNDFSEFNLKLYFIQFEVTTRLYPCFKFTNLALQSAVLLMQILNLYTMIRNFHITSLQTVT